MRVLPPVPAVGLSAKTSKSAGFRSSLTSSANLASNTKKILPMPSGS